MVKCRMLELAHPSEIVNAKRDWRSRRFEVCLFVAIALVPSLIRSLIIYLEPAGLANRELRAPFGEMYLIWDECALLALLYYILARTGRSLTDIGLHFEKADFWRAVMLIAGGWLAYTILEYPIYYGYYFATGHILDVTPKNVPFNGTIAGASIATAVIATLTNPLYEELSVRAYLQTELNYLTGNRWLPALVSVLIQASYHTYQGIVPAFCYLGIFGVFAAYFARTGRAAPIVAAHFFFDAAWIVHGIRL